MAGDTIAAALARAQAQFPPINKSRTARVPTKSGGEYTYQYADISDVLTAVRPVLAAEGIAIVQATEDTDNGCVLVTRLLRGEDSIEGRMPLPIENAGPQQVGSLLTYYRRYGLTALIGVAAEDDDDGQAAQHDVKHGPARRQAKGRPSSDKPASEKQVAFAERLLKEVVHHSLHLAYIAEAVGRDVQLDGLTVAEMSTLIDRLQDDKKAGRTPDGDIAEHAAEGTEPW